MRFIVFIMGLLLSAGVVAAPKEAIRLAVFGDSLAAGYGLSPEEAFYSRLQEALLSKGYRITVENASISGETAAGGVKRLDALIDSKPDAVLLELGINDALKNRPLIDIRANLQKIITDLKKNNIPVMLIGMELPPAYPKGYRRGFVKMYQELAAKNSLILYPFFMKGIFELKPGSTVPLSDKVLGDGMHPDATGVQVMVNNIRPDVEKFLKKSRLQ